MNIPTLTTLAKQEGTHYAWLRQSLNDFEMASINFIHTAHLKKRSEVIRSLEQMFTNFPYPVYLFGSFANGNFHGYSDIDLLILTSKQQARQAYNAACDKLADSIIPYNILTCQSVNELDSTIKSSLHPLNNPQQSPASRKHQQGMTLVEILIAMLIGAFLLGGVIQIFINTKQTYRMQEGLSRLQENGRFAMEFLSQDIRMAGFFGCFSRGMTADKVENELTSTSQTNFAWDITNPIMGYNNVSSSFTTIPSVVAGTDAIAIRGLYGVGIPLVSPYSDSAQMFVDTRFNNDCPSATASTCHIGEILMVTDCSQATIFQATNTQNVGSGSGVNVVHSVNNTFVPGNNSPATFEKKYSAGSQIARLMTYAYYIRLNGANVPALYRSKLSTSTNSTNDMVAEELIEGIENMQILYGVDTDNDRFADRYFTADNVTTWGNVKTVRVSLLARTLDDNLSAQPVPYTFNGVQTTPTDRRLRRIFTTTIALRNRLP